MLKIPHIYIKDIVVRAENDIDISDGLHLASGNHLQPAVIEQPVLVLEFDILSIVSYHDENFYKSTTIKSNNWN